MAAPPGPEADDVSRALDGPVARPMARNATAITGARVLSTVLHFGAFALIAGHLGPARMGDYVFALAIPDLVGPLVDFGFQSTVTRDVAQDPAEERALVPNLFYMRLVLGLIVYAVAVGVLSGAGYAAIQRDAGLVAGLLILVTAAESFQVTLEVRLRLGFVAVGDLAEAVALAAGVVVLSRVGAGVLAFVWLYVAVNCLNIGIVAVRALALRRFRWRPRPHTWAGVARVAAPLGAAALVTGLYYRMNVLILARTHASSAVGEYGAGYRFVDTVGVFPGLLMAVLGPVLARSLVAGPDRLRRRYSQLVHLISVPAALVAVMGPMTAWRALPAVHSFSQYKGAGTVLAVLSPAASFILIGTVLAGVLFSAHQQRLILAVALAVLAVNAALDFGLILPFSYIGAAAATSAGEAVSAVALAVAVRRRLGIPWPMRRLRQVLAASGLTAAALAVGYLLPPFAQIALGLAVFAWALKATGALTADDVAVLLRRPESAA
ncbi:MAG TPA: polysaccharide biosynthesis C-terminal domain-containing protein [Acidimicrobiales bacterium]|nr:polysaccharide biosynthesis C-terminal domain-containing protein [Acidimicrobiales bacterium]